jgi:PBSX family phage terminase large subunit
MKPFSPKGARLIARRPERDAFMTILEGSIRAGKTWVMLAKLIFALRFYKVEGHRVIVGQSIKAIYNNVLKDLFEFIGDANYTFNRSSGELWLFGQRWIVIGAKDEGAERAIRGLTIGLLYVDEVVLLPYNVFQQLLGRMSPDGARFYGTTNPDKPSHWLKEEYLDNEKLPEGYIRSLHFTMDDNLSLSAFKRAQYEASFKGVFYERMIRGKWVIAEGAIYRDVWNELLLYDDAPIGMKGQGGHIDHFTVCDYGTTNQFVLSDVWDDGRVLWFDDEYVWDSNKERRQKTDEQYVEDTIDFMRKTGAYGEVVLDPSAASFKVALKQRGIFVKDADNEVIDGIRMTMSMLGNRLIRFNRRCKNAIKQMPNYAWDPKAAKHGEEEPLKVDDHSPDTVRYAVKTKVPAYRVQAIAA